MAEAVETVARPTQSHPLGKCTARVEVAVPPEMKRRLDAIARSQGVNTSEFIRGELDRLLQYESVLSALHKHPEALAHVRALMTRVSDLEEAHRRAEGADLQRRARLRERQALRLRLAGQTNLHAGLSPTQLKVMWAIARGKTVGEIAAEFGISVNTVSTHRTRILRRTGLKSNAEIVRYAVERRLCDA